MNIVILFDDFILVDNNFFNFSGQFLNGDNFFFNDWNFNNLLVDNWDFNWSVFKNLNNLTDFDDDRVVDDKFDNFWNFDNLFV